MKIHSDSNFLNGLKYFFFISEKYNLFQILVAFHASEIRQKNVFIVNEDMLAILVFDSKKGRHTVAEITTTAPNGVLIHPLRHNPLHGVEAWYPKAVE